MPVSYFKSTDVEVLNLVQDRQPSWGKNNKGKGKSVKILGLPQVVFGLGLRSENGPGERCRDGA